MLVPESNFTEISGLVLLENVVCIYKSMDVTNKTLKKGNNTKSMAEYCSQENVTSWSLSETS